MGEMLLTVNLNVVVGTFIFDWIFFILACNKDNHKSLDEFEFQPDSNTDGVSCP